MPDLKWTVRVKHWKWIYSFSRFGTVTWRDPFNGMTGKGTWKIDGDKMITRWVNSKTWEEWDVPMNPKKAEGKCHISGESPDLKAEALDYYLNPGDVVYGVGRTLDASTISACVVYEDHVKTGGTVAWICSNPGNIKVDDKAFAERHGAYKGKIFRVPKVYGGFAIFPDQATGLAAIVSLLKGWGPMTISQAMHQYAKKGEGKNDPDLYAQIVAQRLHVDVNKKLNTFTDQQFSKMAAAITGVETTKTGKTYWRGHPELPEEIRERWLLYV
jgi:hypothetical protein